jgi:thymidylate kinase
MTTDLARPDEPILCLLGIDGSGKSTLLTEAARAFPDAVAIDWQDFKRMTDIPGVTSGEHLAHVLPKLPGYVRASLLMYMTALEFDRATRASVRGKRPIIIDSYWYKFAAKERTLGSSPSFFLEAVRTFPTPDLVVFLDTPVHVAFERKQEFTRYEGGSDRDEFASFQTAIRREMLGLIEGLPSVVLDGTRPLSQLCGAFADLCLSVERNRDT